MLVLEAEPNGGLLSITLALGRFSPSLPKLLPKRIAPPTSLLPSISCNKQFINAKRRVSGTNSTPTKAFVIWKVCVSSSRSSKSLVWLLMYLSASIKKPAVPAAGSCIISRGCGCNNLTMVSINGRGVKYWPAPDLVSLAFFCNNPSYMSPKSSRVFTTFSPAPLSYQSKPSIVVTNSVNWPALVIVVFTFWKIARTIACSSAPNLTNKLR